MIKILSIVVLISASLYAQSFNEFLNNALKNSPYLKSSNLSISQAQELGSAQTRYENPSLEVEYSQFKPANSSDESGYRATYTQPLRLWGVDRDRKTFADTIEKKAEADYSLTYAQFTRDISLMYSLYANQKKKLELANEELEIAKHIFEISNERNIAGTISKGVVLQAQVDYELVEIKAQSLNIEFRETYFQLLKIAGIPMEIKLDCKHEFKLLSNSDSSQNPDILYFKSKQEEAKASSKINSNKVEWIDLIVEYENESEQDIYRIGASIPLAIFNTKSQEMQIAKLEAKKSELLIKNENARLSLENIRLQKQRNLLLLLKSQNKQTLKSQTKLLKMFEDAYKIASINLLELQNIKNRVIKTKESLLEIDLKLNQNTIAANYITGAYNE